jgi:hypothetical protein
MLEKLTQRIIERPTVRLLGGGETPPPTGCYRVSADGRRRVTADGRRRIPAVCPVVYLRISADGRIRKTAENDLRIIAE